MSTLVLCPSRGRPDAAAAVLESFLETRRDPGSRLVFVVDADDESRDRYPTGYVRIIEPRGSMGGAVRVAAGDHGLLGHATSVGMIGDDCRFRTTGWDEALDGWLSERVGIAWPDDGWAHSWSSEDKAAHWWLSRPIVDAMGMAPPTQHLFMDDYWAQLGHAAGCARFFPDVLVEHLHPLAGKAEMDATYQRSSRFAPGDRRWYRRWQTHGKPDDVRRLRAIAGTTERRRVFADWHHPALWESLSILFEDRFGWELYSPIGLAWARHGWKLQGGTPGWGVREYLEYPEAVPAGDHFEISGAEYPARPRKLVTVAQFESQPWDIVLSSVMAHQRTFLRLAKGKGARYVHHIGDAKRRVDRITRREAIIIASSSFPDPDVVHHQEFDRGLFAPAPIESRSTVSSFMLRLPSTSGPYAWLAEAEGIDWWAVESASPRDPGYLAPMSAVAEQLRRTGWVWHDKRVGDGYGHVLFTAAAVGRPLIGHASHYRGLMGEPLWQDLKTCIDLDQHAAEDALGLIRSISADPDRHDELAANMRATFAELVDFDAEAARIRAALA